MAGDGHNDVPAGETRPDISIGRDGARDTPDPKPEGEGAGHPLPASEKARHGSIPETLERARGHGAN